MLGSALMWMWMMSVFHLDVPVSHASEPAYTLAEGWSQYQNAIQSNLILLVTPLFEMPA